MKLTDVLTGVGCAGVIATGALSYRAGEKLKEKEVNLLEIRSWDDFKNVLPDIGPALIAGGLTIADICVTREVNAKTIAGITVASAGTVEMYKRVQDKLKDVVGAEKFNEIKSEVSKELYSKLPTKKPSKAPKKAIPCAQLRPHEEVAERAIDPLTDNPTQFVLEIPDSKNGTRRIRFESTLAQVIWAESNLNKDYTESCIESVARYLEWLNLQNEITAYDNIQGWSYESIVDMVGDCTPACIFFEYYVWTDDAGNSVCTIACDTTPPVYQPELDQLFNGNH